MSEDEAKLFRNGAQSTNSKAGIGLSGDGTLTITWDRNLHDGNSDMSPDSPLILYPDGRADFTALIDNNKPWHVMFSVRYSDGASEDIPDINYRLVHSLETLHLSFRGGSKLALFAGATMWAAKA